MKHFVLDSFALLAYIQDEPGAAEVEEILEQSRLGQARAFSSLINVGEVLYQVERRWGDESVAHYLGILQELPVTIAQVTPNRVYAAAHIKATHPISYADCFVAGLAQELNAEVLTGDPEFRKLGNSVQVRWLPQR